MWRFAIPLVIVVALVAVFWRGLFLDPGKVPSPLVGKPAPEFSLPGLHDPADRFTNADLQGQISLLNIFGTWCPGCHEEHPVLMRWAATQDVPIFGIDWAQHYDNERAAAIDWLAREGNPYAKIGFDASGDTIIDWGVYGAPETFLLDANGRVRMKHIGVITEEVLRDRIVPAIEALRAEEAAQ